MMIDDQTKKTYQSLLDSTTTRVKNGLEDASSFAQTLADEIKAKFSTDNEASTIKDSETTQRDPAVETFLEDLKTKGALAFYQDYNFEKIEKLIEEKKAELTEKLGLGESTQPPLTGKAREDALTSLDDMLDAYRKQLQEKMQAEDKLDQQNTMLGTFLQDLA
ncbi:MULTISPECIES: hypothetical protein [Sulfurospirillum]|jgi:hypothetical protein|uniref:hypothetical protein n=1 Tax=Sulfurospirillum TaxID=57665 RepID=UPI0005A974DA|nr:MULTISPECIES: hypothetical protein [Sulfurospirillum]MCP3651985.1 hypothetical protein [Sulfurospirillum sp. DNRA8]MCR1810832.1 hypothetical protein [Sulfurospirillum sp. DNRA8]